MGTINFHTSDIITLALEPYDFSYDDYLKECDDGATESEYEDYINECYQNDYDNALSVINKYDFKYYHIALKYGYYESFSVDIENNYGVCYDDYIEKRNAAKELTQLKNCLIELLGYGLRVCHPGWCTSYLGYNDSIKAIQNAIKEERENIKHIPTWYYYENNIPCVRG